MKLRETPWIHLKITMYKRSMINLIWSGLSEPWGLLRNRCRRHVSCQKSILYMLTRNLHRRMLFSSIVVCHSTTQKKMCVYVYYLCLFHSLMASISTRTTTTTTTKLLLLLFFLTNFRPKSLFLSLSFKIVQRFKAKNRKTSQKKIKNKPRLSWRAITPQESRFLYSTSRKTTTTTLIYWWYMYRSITKNKTNDTDHIQTKIAIFCVAVRFRFTSMPHWWSLDHQLNIYRWIVSCICIVWDHYLKGIYFQKHHTWPLNFYFVSLLSLVSFPLSLCVSLSLFITVVVLRFPWVLVKHKRKKEWEGL